MCRIGLKIAIADLDEAKLTETAKQVAQIVGEANLISLPTDVTKLDQVERLRDRVYEAWGEVSRHASRPRAPVVPGSAARLSPFPCSCFLHYACCVEFSGWEGRRRAVMASHRVRSGRLGCS